MISRIWKDLKKLSLSLAIVTISCASARAQESQTGTEDWNFWSREYAAVASQNSEPLRETPVITTVITDQEIRRMGARTLNDVLLTIPGFSRIQDHNEYYSAERGVYGSSQQKILVLRDGHRLNSRSYSEANFGPAIGLGNVERIEIMRGPGAALYGDVALTAVINIVTKDGKDINGAEVTVGAGDFGSFKTNVLAGESVAEGKDISAFASVYRTNGEKRHLDASHDFSSVPEAGTTVLDRFGTKKPPYDIGLKYKTGNLSFMASSRYEHYTMPRSGGGGYGQLIDLDDYRRFEGEQPGLSSEFKHFEIKYVSQRESWPITIRPYADTFSVRGNEPQRRAGEPGALAATAKGYLMKWDEVSYGCQLSTLKHYQLTSLGSGELLTGAQFERMVLRYSWDIHSPDLTHADYWVGSPEILPNGAETSSALYFQVKHNFNKHWILNTGARYDYKSRYQKTGSIYELSPRSAIIYLPNDIWNFRMNYGRSFVDSPYWYRQNLGSGGYAGSGSLEPEILDSYQFNIGHAIPNSTLHQRLNFFVNNFTNFIFRDADGTYKNSGALKTRGVEYELGLQRANFSGRANYTYQYTESASKGFLAKNHRLDSIPSHIGNLIVDYAPLQKNESPLLGGMWLHYNMKAVGPQYAPIGKANAQGCPAAGCSEQDLNHISNGYLISNAGINFEDAAKDTTIRFHVYNVFNQRYTQGGSVNLPYEQPGRWFMAQISNKF